MLINLFKQGLSPKEIVYYLLIMLFALLLSFSVHEFMHAAAADWLGDRTPRNMGRLTLNPIAHMDPAGMILLLVAGFGWGKPVTYNPSRLDRFKNRRLMNVIVHLAGVTGNFIVALLSGIISTLVYNIGATRVDPQTPAAIAVSTVFSVFYYTEMFSLMLLAFNLLPVPPLDGFHVLEELLPYKLKSTSGYRKFQMVSPYCIWVLFLLSYVSSYDVLGWIIQKIEWPFAFVIEAVCNLISLPFGVG